MEGSSQVSASVGKSERRTIEMNFAVSQLQTSKSGEEVWNNAKLSNFKGNVMKW